MWREFKLGDIVVTLFHSHGQKNVSKGRINGSWGNLFNERVEPVKM